MPHPPASFRGVAVDLGNSALHAGWFGSRMGELPRPSRVVVHDRGRGGYEALLPLLPEDTQVGVPWRIASVNDSARRELEQWLERTLPAHPRHIISHDDVPVAVDVDQPEKVGVDRLLAVAAARAMCGAHPSAIVVDAGTAITVDCLSDGAFRGGAILPGMRMAAAALDRYTDKLPLIDTDILADPAAIGRDTIAAMRSGVFWGTVGAIGRLIALMADGLRGRTRVFITGGDGKRLAAHLPHCEYVRDMVLTGIALATPNGERNDDR